MLNPFFKPLAQQEVEAAIEKVKAQMPNLHKAQAWSETTLRHTAPRKRTHRTISLPPRTVKRRRSRQRSKMPVKLRGLL